MHNLHESLISRKSFNHNNLPRMDSNHDKVIQSHLCYRYTTRQNEGDSDTISQANRNCQLSARRLCVGTRGHRAEARPFRTRPSAAGSFPPIS